MPVPSWPTSALHHADLLLKLPRELRDKVYADALNADRRVGLTEDLLPHIPPILREYPHLLPEALEILTKTQTFAWSFDDPRIYPLNWTRECVKPYDVRHLDITCSEYIEHFDLEGLDEHEIMYRDLSSRGLWERLMQFPRLQNLTIYMQKNMEDKSLNTLDFGPVLHRLRDKLPKIKVTFFLSFDEILRDSWNDAMWNNDVLSADVPPYKSMGFVDMSDLIAPPTAEDLAYVQEYLPEYVNTGRMPQSRHISTGLLDESPANRRALAKHYAVKEPALLRCLMRDHFEIYRKQQDCISKEEST
ncbi:hypothetical protein PMIN01_02146 [Paraphaeosphaeria minitans]|uniref:Uncharacterized protein n=1 Tax=Paraphaeosphaeria minitans TaxID=565426 RepID=A0A9P6GPK1_9PLEO|nr:hypothetical protein PMIN01_02146 [Paraphaeosphaeria minitans]